MSQSTIFADTGNGTTLTFGSTTFAAKVRRITMPSHGIDPIEVSTLDTTGFEKSIQGDLVKRPTLVFTVLWDTYLNPPSLTSAPETITVTFPTRTGESSAATYAGTAFFQDIKFPELANGVAQEAQITVVFNGGTGPAWTKST